MKNFIISLLLIVILNLLPGEWGVHGISRFVVNIVLIVLVDTCICEFERVCKYGDRKR